MVIKFFLIMVWVQNIFFDVTLSILVGLKVKNLHIFYLWNYKLLGHSEHSRVIWPSAFTAYIQLVFTHKEFAFK